MRKAAFYCAVVCLVLSLVVHVVSFFGVSLFDRFAFLHLGIFVMGIPAALSVKKRGLEPGHWWPSGANRKTGAPRWGGKALTIGFAYSVLNFAALLVLSRAWSASAEGGWQRAHEARMFSAGWALAYLFFVVWYWPVPRRLTLDTHGVPLGPGTDG